ncbi:uncharacterized protein B0T15DRAFT_44243 [Chaetomium strumarium]|uniref:Uncharacterized protein n=1 Tax=Chaetomium strumarium TaxID=1170767 RepID=A0AAJ0H2H2_9PEZI|nr:hypothetical protein B0T15DRAFT_44243 [Chaetomium strumarium]
MHTWESRKMPFDIDDFKWPCEIGFRVEVHDHEHWLNNCTFDQYGNMKSREPNRTPDEQACLDHFNWRCRRPGPFISMYANNWNKALDRRRWYLEKGATNVVIVAVWLKKLPVYDAYTLAGFLRIPDNKCDPDELLVLGGIAADQYRILATFDGMGNPGRALLSLNGLNVDVLLPPAFIGGNEHAYGFLPNATDKLRDEFYSCTGERDGIKFCKLAIALAGIRSTFGTKVIVVSVPPEH